jgi:hypothetical protein
VIVVHVRAVVDPVAPDEEDALISVYVIPDAAVSSVVGVASVTVEIPRVESV